MPSDNPRICDDPLRTADFCPALQLGERERLVRAGIGEGLGRDLGGGARLWNPKKYGQRGLVANAPSTEIPTVATKTILA